MPHEVVNSPETGAVTWCSGIGCPRCQADQALNERLRRGEPINRHITYDDSKEPAGGTWHWPERV